MSKDFKTIGFDADDTLWVNEPYFKETENKLCQLLVDYESPDVVSSELFKTEMQNLENYGFGTKSFMLSMIETAANICNHNLSTEVIRKILDLGKKQINKPVELLDGIETILKKLKKAGYRLVVATKGDLLDQERKLSKSNIEQYFHHIEIMSDKKENNYMRMLQHLDIKPEEFLMVGNSLKSDILPVINIGGFGVHVPYHTTWLHEEMDKVESLNNCWEIEHISELISILGL
jgi:putative hydrolase of the HAD superfamily